MHIARKEAELLSTRALVRGQFASIAKSAESATAAYEAYQAYADSMFPFLEKASKIDATDQQRLLEHVQHPMEIDVASVRADQARQHRAKGLKKFKFVEDK